MENSSRKEKPNHQHTLQASWAKVLNLKTVLYLPKKVTTEKIDLLTQPACSAGTLAVTL